MASFIRRIQRQVVTSQVVHPVLDLDGEPTGKFHSNPPREKFWMGRGSKLGIRNPKDACRVAREARESRRAKVSA